MAPSLNPYLSTSAPNHRPYFYLLPLVSGLVIFIGYIIRYSTYSLYQGSVAIAAALWTAFVLMLQLFWVYKRMADARPTASLAWAQLVGCATYALLDWLTDTTTILHLLVPLAATASTALLLLKARRLSLEALTCHLWIALPISLLFAGGFVGLVFLSLVADGN